MNKMSNFNDDNLLCSIEIHKVIMNEGKGVDLPSLRYEEGTPL